MNLVPAVDDVEAASNGEAASLLSNKSRTIKDTTTPRNGSGRAGMRGNYQVQRLGSRFMRI